jgi:predicted transglutaminase-like cysteine proteinase
MEQAPATAMRYSIDLMQAGGLRQALLMTIVHESDNEGHAVVTVATDHCDYILDNLTDKILLWSQTPYLLHASIAG